VTVVVAVIVLPRGKTIPKMTRAIPSINLCKTKPVEEQKGPLRRAFFIAIFCCEREETVFTIPRTQRTRVTLGRCTVILTASFGLLGSTFLD
jgi:hypothetical protein